MKEERLILGSTYQPVFAESWTSEWGSLEGSAFDRKPKGPRFDSRSSSSCLSMWCSVFCSSRVSYRWCQKSHNGLVWANLIQNLKCFWQNCFEFSTLWGHSFETEVLLPHREDHSVEVEWWRWLPRRAAKSWRSSPALAKALIDRSRSPTLTRRYGIRTPDNRSSVK